MHTKGQYDYICVEAMTVAGSSQTRGWIASDEQHRNNLPESQLYFKYTLLKGYSRIINNKYVPQQRYIYIYLVGSHKQWTLFQEYQIYLNEVNLDTAYHKLLTHEIDLDRSVPTCKWRWMRWVGGVGWRRVCPWDRPTARGTRTPPRS